MSFRENAMALNWSAKQVECNDVSIVFLILELSQGRTQGCESSCIVQSCQDPQLVQGVVNVVLGRWIHEVKIQQIFHVQ